MFHAFFPVFSGLYGLFLRFFYADIFRIYLYRVFSAIIGFIRVFRVISYLISSIFRNPGFQFVQLFPEICTSCSFFPGIVPIFMQNSSSVHSNSSCTQTIHFSSVVVVGEN